LADHGEFRTIVQFVASFGSLLIGLGVVSSLTVG
jgi:hypothetical protein